MIDDKALKDEIYGMRKRMKEIAAVQHKRLRIGEGMRFDDGTA